MSELEKYGLNQEIFQDFIGEAAKKRGLSRDVVVVELIADMLLADEKDFCDLDCPEKNTDN
jgi:hypothetical protein